MAEYIEREALMNEVQKNIHQYWNEDGGGYYLAEDAIDTIRLAPVADVAPVVHGEWVDHMCRDWRCSECGEQIRKVRNVDGYCYDDKPNFCPNCGAKMDGERKGVPETNVGKMANWKLTDVDESGYEYECPHCFFHIGARVKGRDLPEECPNCGADMRERKGDDDR